MFCNLSQPTKQGSLEDAANSGGAASGRSVFSEAGAVYGESWSDFACVEGVFTWRNYFPRVIFLLVLGSSLLSLTLPPAVNGSRAAWDGACNALVSARRKAVISLISLVNQSPLSEVTSGVVNKAVTGNLPLVPSQLVLSSSRPSLAARQGPRQDLQLDGVPCFTPDLGTFPLAVAG